MAESTIKNVNVGKLPVYCGNWIPNFDDNNGYYLYNHVTFCGSEFISLKDKNLVPPAVIITDDDGRWIDYKINDGWNIVANAIDASIALSKNSEYTETISHKAKFVIKDLFDNTTNEDHTKYGCCFYGDKYSLTYDVKIETYGGEAETGVDYPKYFSDSAYVHEISKTQDNITDTHTTYAQTKPKKGVAILGTSDNPLSHTIHFYDRIIYGFGFDALSVAKNGTTLDYPSEKATVKLYTLTNTTGGSGKFYILSPTGEHGVKSPTILSLNDELLKTETGTLLYNGIKYNVISTVDMFQGGKSISIYATSESEPLKMHDANLDSSVAILYKKIDELKEDIQENGNVLYWE